MILGLLLSPPLPPKSGSCKNRGGGRTSTRRSPPPVLGGVEESLGGAECQSLGGSSPVPSLQEKPSVRRGGRMSWMAAKEDGGDPQKPPGGFHWRRRDPREGFSSRTRPPTPGLGRGEKAMLGVPRGGDQDGLRISAVWVDSSLSLRVGGLPLWGGLCWGPILLGPLPRRQPLEGDPASPTLLGL